MEARAGDGEVAGDGHPVARRLSLVKLAAVVLVTSAATFGIRAGTDAAADAGAGAAPSVAVDEPRSGRPRPGPTFNPDLVPHDFAPAAASAPSSAHCVDLDGAPHPVLPSLRGEITRRNEEVLARLRRVAADPELGEDVRRAVVLAIYDEPSADGALRELRKAPWRWHQGFDLLAEVETVVAVRALDEDPERARGLAREALALAPQELLPRFVEIAASEALHRPTDAAHAARSAFAVAPTDPLVAFEQYLRVRDGVDVSAAIAALDGYLATSPWNLWVTRRRARLAARRAAMGDVVTRTHGGVTSAIRRELDDVYVVHALDTTAAALDAAAALLDVPRRPDLTLFVYGTRRELIEVTCAAEWTGGLYDGAIHVTAEALPDVEWAEVVLRHEALHAAMDHAVELSAGSSSPPVWFREGVAQYFADGVTPSTEETFALLVRHHTFAPLSSMDGAFGDIEEDGDARVAYHQALAMVLYLVERRSERGIAEAMHHLTGGGSAANLLASIGAPLDGERLLAFLEERAARHARWTDGMAAATSTP